MNSTKRLKVAVVGSKDEYTNSLVTDDQFEFFLVNPAELLSSQEQLSDAECVLLWDCPPAAMHELLELGPRLQWAHWKSAGVENVPLQLFKERQITFTNSAGVYAESLAEFVLLGLLHFIKDVPLLQRQQTEERWQPYTVRELRNSRALIVGYGGIGRAIAERLAALKVEVIAARNRITEVDPFVTEMIKPDSILEVLPSIDHLIVSAPLTAETRGMIGERELRALKSSSVVVNVGRGPIIEEAALLNALRERRILGAALDVFDIEPLPKGHPFWQLDNVLVSPHTADRIEQWLWDSMAGFRELLKLRAAGKPLTNVVDYSRGY